MLATGPGLRHSVRGGRIIIEGGRKPRRAGSVAAHPFKFLIRPKPGFPTTTQGGVVYESSLYKSRRPNHKQAITGLLSEDRTTGWFDLINNDAIWLGIIFDSAGEITSAQIDSWGTSGEFDVTADAWSGENGYCEDDGESPPKFQAARKLIAYTIAGEDGKPIPHQVMSQHQILEDCVIDARYARLPIDYDGGYPL